MRALLTRRWLTVFALALLASFVMVLLGRWQWGRYELRSAINDRIDASTVVNPVPVGDVLAPAPSGRGAAPGPGEDRAWTRVTATGRYDAAQEILIRNRTVDGQVGYEVLTPLLLADGSALLVDRGWVPPHPDGITVAPDYPTAPAGTVTVVGRVHLTESGAGAVDQRNGRWETRRVGVPAIAERLPYPVLGAYVLADQDTPGAQGLTAVTVGHENDWLNLGYAVQWWIFAAGALVGVGYLARRDLRQEAAERAAAGPDPDADDPDAAAGTGEPFGSDGSGDQKPTAPAGSPAGA
ncbi:SURF1 family protein [Catellatospora bangladeshensis]|uniref:SURF1-like protein n=1 Tax=Catellatospora bangladeshensis TaxID=310355 RepID=A0A8J3NMJ0_9ACTN|nr:SURF1 family protein [Catellatospora bangladeshensis]GIF85078.1 SURF1-like protein [Catellatospora bangladeshensis]